MVLQAKSNRMEDGGWCRTADCWGTVCLVFSNFKCRLQTQMLKKLKPGAEARLETRLLQDLY
jgi:hypothetical protein